MRGLSTKAAIWTTIIVSVVVLITVFFVTTAIMANVHNLSIIGQLQAWFTPEKTQAAEEVVETVETVAHILG